MSLMKIISKLEGFKWDEWNAEKNILKHEVYPGECEEVFFNNPTLGEAILSKSKSETRYYALGITDKKRMLAIIFTIRGNKIRVISARDMSKKERMSYERQI